MSTTPAPDLQNMPLEELKRLAEAESAAPVVVDPPAPITEQPRGPDGKFVSTTPAPDPIVEDTDPRQFVVREVVPRANGGEEVFIGTGATELEAYQNCVKEIAKGKAHLNAHAYRLEQERKVEATPATPKYDPDDQFVKAQRLMTTPDEVLEETYNRLKEKDPDFQELRETRRINAATKVFEEWQTTRPEFYFTPANGKKIGNMLGIMYNGVATQENIEACYQQLKDEELLQVKPAPAPVVDPVPVVPAPPARRSSGISSLPSVPPPVSSEPSVEDLYAMPLHQLEALARKGQNGPRGL